MGAAVSTGEVSLGGSAGSTSVGLAGDAWSDLTPHPVRRWIARWFDFYVTTAGVFIALATPWGLFRSGDARFVPLAIAGVLYVLTPVRGLVTALLNAAMLSATSTTPGKWLCGVRIVRKDGGRMSFGLALRRELAVWVLGCGCYIPLVVLLAMGWSFSRLSEAEATGWDEARALVALQRPNTGRQFALSLLAFAMAAIVVLTIVALGVVLRFAHDAATG
jgi:uncharacterized RDD family membrane protein YckC